jgi:hypothetical protein
MRLMQTIGAVSVAICCAAESGSAADFYAGKTLTMMINYQAGGPADLEGRIIARHLAKHIAGNPNVIVRNMGGAGGAVGANWLGQVAPPDGMTFGILTGAASKAATGDPAIKIDLAALDFVAAGGGTSVAYVRTDTPPGVKTPADLMKAKNFWAGGLTADSGKDLQLRMQLDLLDVPYRYVTGYAGTAEARLALQRSEIQMYVESLPTYRALIEPTFVTTGQAIPVWYSANEAEAPAKVAAEMEGVQALPFGRFYEQARGRKPSGQLWDALETVGEMSTVYLRVAAMAPGSPKEASDALKKAFVTLADDREYQTEAMATMKFIPSYLVDQRVEAQFKKKLHMDAGLQRFVRDYIDKGKEMAGK